MKRASRIRSTLAIWPLLLGASVGRAQFPSVQDLPSRPELPDPLVMLNGQRVTTRDQWVSKRRPELKALFEFYMYGAVPAAPGKVTAKVTHENGKAFESVS